MKKVMKFLLLSLCVLLLVGCAKEMKEEEKAEENEPQETVTEER